MRADTGDGIASLSNAAAALLVAVGGVVMAISRWRGSRVEAETDERATAQQIIDGWRDLAREAKAEAAAAKVESAEALQRAVTAESRAAIAERHAVECDANLARLTERVHQLEQAGDHP